MQHILPDTGGSYEVNPPFDRESITRATCRMRELLLDGDRRSLPVSFCMVCPYNKETFSRITSHFRGFLRGVSIIGNTSRCPPEYTNTTAMRILRNQKNAWFTMGVQHETNNSRFGEKGKVVGGSWMATFPQLFAVFQNSAGFAKWNCTNEQMFAVMDAFTVEPDELIFRVGKTYADHNKDRAQKLNALTHTKKGSSGAGLRDPPLQEKRPALALQTQTPRSRTFTFQDHISSDNNYQHYSVLQTWIYRNFYENPSVTTQGNEETVRDSMVKFLTENYRTLPPDDDIRWASEPLITLNEGIGIQGIPRRTNLNGDTEANEN